jgi:itaconyl-CoA hydratase
MGEEWRSRFYEDLEVGDVYRSRFGRTVTETDNLLFTALTMNTNQLHFSSAYAAKTRWKKILVNSTFTLALVTGLSVADVTEHAAANLAWTDVTLPNPVFFGDTIWAETEILDRRESRSNSDVGIVSMRTRGINQRHEVVVEFKRAVMVYKRTAPAAADDFPGTETEWGVS